MSTEAEKEAAITASLELLEENIENFELHRQEIDEDKIAHDVKKKMEEYESEIISEKKKEKSIQ